MKTKGPVNNGQILIGQRIRAFRLAAGLSQSELGRVLGVSFQQVQKYENGQNSFNSTRLSALANALQCNVEEILRPLPVSPNGQAGFIDELLSSADGMNLAKLFVALPARERKIIILLAKALKRAGAEV